MSARPRLFEDLSRIAGGALGTLSGVRQEVSALVRQTLDRMIGELHLVRREEFDVVMELAQRAKTESEQLAERLAALEERVRTADHAAATDLKMNCLPWFVLALRRLSSYPENDAAWRPYGGSPSKVSNAGIRQRYAF